MASGFAESRYGDNTGLSESGYGGSSSGGYNPNVNMDAYRANKAALKGRPINQATLDEAARVGALGKDSSGKTVRDAAAWDRAPVSAPAKKGGAGTLGMQDYIDMISNAAFGGRGAAPAAQVAPIPATMSPQLAAQRAGNLTAPIPAVRSDQVQLQQALNNGATLEALAAGAAGAGVGYLAKSLLDQMRSAKGETISPSNGVYNGPNTDLGPGNSGQGIPVVKGSGVTRVPQGTQQFGAPMDWRYLDNIIDGDFVDMTDRGISGPQDYKLTTGDDGITREQGVPAYKDTSGVPGPDSRARQLGDMDSPNFRKQMGLTDTVDATLDPYINQRAEEAHQVMQEYGIDDPRLLGITPENNPTLFNRLSRILNPR